MIEYSSIIDLIEVQSSIHVKPWHGSSFNVILIKVYYFVLKTVRPKVFRLIASDLVICIRLISDTKGLVRIN